MIEKFLAEIYEDLGEPAAVVGLGEVVLSGRAILGEHRSAGGWDRGPGKPGAQRIRVCRCCADTWVLDGLARQALIGLEYPCQTVRLLARPFRGRPGYDEAWAPHDTDDPAAQVTEGHMRWLARAAAQISADDLGLLVWCAMGYDRKLPGGGVPSRIWDALSGEWRGKINAQASRDTDVLGAQLRSRSS